MDEIDVPVEMVRRLVDAQFPQWAELPLRPVKSTGTVNALYRLGTDLVVRMCRIPGAADDVGHEHRWLPRLAAYLPVAVPEIVAQGRPGKGYPWTWSVLRWLPGRNPMPGQLANPDAFATDLATFIRAFRTVDLPGGPPAYRSGPLTELDEQARTAITQLRHTIDTATASAIWHEALRTPGWNGPPTWVHADLMPGNQLTVNGRLTAVIDFATAGTGDPACDLIVAWLVLPAESRNSFRDAVDVDDATWTRARGRALALSLGGLAYYANLEPTLAANAHYALTQILTDR